MRKNESEKFFKPGNLPKLCQTYANIDNLLDSDIFVRIIINVLHRCIVKSKLHSDGQLAKILHLIGLALHKEKNANMEDEFKFLGKAETMFETKKLSDLLQKVINITTTEQYKLLAMWNLECIQNIKDHKNPVDTESSDIPMQCSETEQSVTTTKLLSIPEGSSEKSGLIQKDKRKNLLAEKRRAKILAQLNKQQKNFILNNKVNILIKKKR